MGDSRNEARDQARALLVADKRRWARVVSLCLRTVVLVTILSVLLIVLGIVPVGSFGMALSIIVSVVLFSTFMAALIAFNHDVPKRLRVLNHAFSTSTDLDLKIVDLIDPLANESNEEIEVRVARVSAAIKAVEQEAVRARALGATATEVEVYIEMEIEDVPGFADCDPEVIGPVLDYLERLRKTESVPGDEG